MNSNLKSALRKLRHHNGREWGASLTPCEILALVEDGIKPTKSNEHLVEDSKRRKEKGDCTRVWFYCIPSKYRLENFNKNGTNKVRLHETIYT